MQSKHWALIGGCLVSIGVLGQSVEMWTIEAGIKFFFGILGVVGTQIGALYMQRPNEVQSKRPPPRFPHERP